MKFIIERQEYNDGKVLFSVSVKEHWYSKYRLIYSNISDTIKLKLWIKDFIRSIKYMGISDTETDKKVDKLFGKCKFELQSYDSNSEIYYLRYFNDGNKLIETIDNF